ncbi:6-phosphofructokinase [Gaeumannomyces tritici R3-111a-1]|uniref:ATP-dependent 6-phosphofructokinase n=1 Tax=Gaeumannomyces tritici (strain R3-111a-1) TaxID=644352 RepID=J3PD76_GAET3|nr:6-phosphofructokinase [Gaeumannomyces tritici R3-111a-1]EJT70421.1 6-phosphofructokinase [Gaeumannomyces tritici R3-111a-1]
MDSPKKKIAVMTSGGDAPGMNAAVRAVVRMAIHMGCDAYCVYRGYEGLVRGGDDIKKTSWEDVRNYLATAGTQILTARCMAFYERPGRLIAAKNMVLNGIDALIICGGDGSLTGADKFRAEWPSLLDELVQKGELSTKQVQPYRHLNIVGLVGSIDNDLSGTDATIGCYTALMSICECIEKIDSTAESHERAFVVEVMGRHCGWLALMAAIATGADFVFIPEKPRDNNWKEEMCAIIQKNREIGTKKTIVIIAEGAHDRHGRKITAHEVHELLADEEGLGLDTRTSVLGHLQRGGKAVAYDRMLATLQGVEAVKAVLEATPETPTCVIAMSENQIIRKNLMEAVQDTKKVADAIKAQDFDLALSLRDVEFAEQYKSYMMLTSVNLNKSLLLPKEKQMRIGFINVGAPAGGMNAATRAGVAYCMSRGHEAVKIENGFAGFARHHGDVGDKGNYEGSVKGFDWFQVDKWGTLGGSEIGTNRELPSESGMEHIANLVGKYKLDAMFIVGGFEAFRAVSELRQARDKYPSLCIPFALLPATVSNNVPGTEYSLGSDTCLNALVQFCDTIKQSAASTRRRVFVVETQGGRCGYVATLAGLACGASAVYTPEEGISMSMLDSDIKHLKAVFAKDKGRSRAGRLILVAEKASKVYTAQVIGDLIREEAHGRFESRDITPRHWAQGDTPSPMDRCRAVRLAIKCIEHLESYGKGAPEKVKADPMSSGVISITGSQVSMRPIEEIETNETDWQNRRSKTAFWAPLRDIVDILGGRPSYDTPETTLEGLRAKDVKRGLE